MFVTMVAAALIVAGAFALLGLIPSGPRPTRADIFGSVQLDYKLALNVLGAAVFAALFWLTPRRGATDPVCGMRSTATRRSRAERRRARCTSARRAARRPWESGQSAGGRAVSVHGRRAPSLGHDRLCESRRASGPCGQVAAVRAAICTGGPGVAGRGVLAARG